MTNKEQAKEKLEREAARREVYDLRVLVVGGGYAYLKMFFDAGFRGAKSVQDADIICFTGGEDVDPGLYSEEMMPATYFDRARQSGRVLFGIVFPLQLTNGKRGIVDAER